MAKVICILLLAFCLLAADAKKKTSAPKEEELPKEDSAQADDETQEEEKDADVKTEDRAEVTDDDETAKPEEKEDEGPEVKDATAGKEEEDSSEEESTDASEKEEDEEQTPEFACNLKFKKVGCYSDKSKNDKPLRSYIMSDADLGSVAKKGKLPRGDKFNQELPKFACKCANEALNSGNAIFGLQNIAECWTGPDDSKYDKDGESQNCVTFDYAACDASSTMCAGKKHANFVYYVDTPEHTKTKEEIAKEYASYKKKVAAYRKKQAAKKKAAKKLKKKSRKVKKE